MTTYRIISEQVKANCIAEIDALYGPWVVTIKKEGRSGGQNRYFHQLVDVIAKFTGDDPDDVKLRLKYECLPLREIEVRGVKHLYPIGTSELTKEEFSPLIEKTLFVGHQLGLKMPLASHYGLE